ncbi:unnamed protein product [Alopecurus aequalis]
MKTMLMLVILAVAMTNIVAHLETVGIQSGSEQQQIPQQPFMQHPLNPCRVFLLQLCVPLAMPPFVRSQMLPLSTCQVMQQQCCQKLAQIPALSRCPAVCSLTYTTIFQQRQQQLGHGFFQPQLQQPSQGFAQPQQLGQFEMMRNIAVSIVPAMCNVYMPSYCTAAPLGGMSGC